MSEPYFGINIGIVDNEPRPAVVSDMSVVGMVVTAPDANAETFPLNTPVFMYSDDAAMITALGATGTAADAVDGINQQLGEFQVAAELVVVRVAPGANTNETITNILGNQGAGTGMWALKKAGSVLGKIPRIIIVPGFTSQMDSQLATLTLGTQGSGYTAAPTVVFAGGGSDGSKVLPTATAVLGTGGNAGKVVALNITGYGSHLTDTLTVSFTPVNGNESAVSATATAVVAATENAVCANLTSILDSLLGIAIVDGPATTQQAYNDWVETISSKRIIPMETAVKVGVDAVVEPGSPRMAGIMVRRDHEFSGRPFHSCANQAVQGIVGPNRPIHFSLTDGATEGQAILAAHGAIIVRGEMGVENAIAEGGFVLLGTDTCSDDDLWRFYNVVRGRDYIHLMFLRTLRFFLGKNNITAHTITQVQTTMSLALRDLKVTGDILGYEVKFTRDANSPENLRAGKFTINFAAEEAPVLRELGIQSARYRPALDALMSDLLAQVDAITG